ncbi:P-loop containing nucleoside triphosphate hydrolase protein [Flagelloscypha sp. PMI_526]|nr:P-loop containing nucleoside triphosphate hydrolase protein [Flagelloscypha sp. PMI_526]
MTMGRLKLRKDPGVPKLPDLKTKNKAASLNKANENQDNEMASEPMLSTLAELAAAAEASAFNFSSTSNPESSSYRDVEQRQNQRTFVRTLRKVIDESDIIVLVLDGRDPDGCRSRLVEEEVLRREAEGKRLVFVLNKIDLIPKENAQAWLKYLRHTVPTLPFRSTAGQSQGAAPAVNTAPALLKLLKSYRPSSARSITIGVVGFPNVGKSSLINALKKSKVCSTSSTPGHTTSLQSVQLERGIRIVDSPGVVWYEDSAGVSKKGSMLLRNVVKVESIDDPIAVVEQILARTRASTLRNIYNLPPPDEPTTQDDEMIDEEERDRLTDTLEFLTMVALTGGRLLKGGTPDIIAAARQIIQDWNQHKIPFWSTPPTIHPSMVAGSSNVSKLKDSTADRLVPGAEDIGNAAIKTSFAPAFRLEGLFNSADASALDDGKMVEDEDANDEFYDAMEDGEVETEVVDPDASEMLTDDTFSLAALSSRKRMRSLSPEPNEDPNSMDTQLPGYVTRQPKRQRRQMDREDNNKVAINPLSRKNLKKVAKKARKAWRNTHGPGMVVEQDVGDTFMAD